MEKAGIGILEDVRIEVKRLSDDPRVPAVDRRAVDGLIGVRANGCGEAVSVEGIHLVASIDGGLELKQGAPAPYGSFLMLEEGYYSKLLISAYLSSVF